MFVWRVDRLYVLKFGWCSLVINMVGILWSVVYFFFFIVLRMVMGLNFCIGIMVVLMDIYVKILSMYLK